MTVESGTLCVLEDEAPEYLRRLGKEVEFAEGDTILRNVNGTARKSGVRIRTAGWTLLIVVCTISTFGALWLVAGSATRVLKPDRR